ncbi:MAG: hypothetical protein JO141_27165 [Bradyrhizobium sp.]|nr:hypothetical protein [Bradyrhizobium sp.]
MTEIEAAAYWLDWIKLGKNIGAFLVAVGVAAEFLGDYVAKPYEDKIEAVPNSLAFMSKRTKQN